MYIQLTVVSAILTAYFCCCASLRAQLVVSLVGLPTLKAESGNFRLWHATACIGNGSLSPHLPRRVVKERLTCNTKFSDLKHSITKVVCPANCLTHSHELCGNGIYSRGPICLAAIQDQQIDDSGGLVTVYATDGRMKYHGDQRNGVFSRPCGPSNKSYTFSMTCSTDGNSETEVTQVVCPPNCPKSRVYPCGTDCYQQNSSVCGAARVSEVTQGQRTVTFYKKASAPSADRTGSPGSFTFQNNVDHCDLGNRCENNSTCVNGITGYFCACPNGYFGKFCQDRHCWTDERLTSYVSSNGVTAVCDTGWTVFQIRDDPTVNFNRSWSEYETGFGSASTSFWWGLENVHQGTKHGTCSLRIDLWDFSGNHKFAVYSSFAIASKSEKYRLHVAGYQPNSTAVDAITDAVDYGNDKRNSYNNGMFFSTYDSDNDIFPNRNCGAERGGGWWFNHCGRSGLNGPIWRHPTSYAYLRWHGRTTTKFPWQRSSMKFRCK